jgi:hypothetical protein
MVKRVLASESGAHPSDILVGAFDINEGLRVQLLKAQLPGSGRRIAGPFRLLGCGIGTYAEYLKPFEGSVVPSAQELIESVRNESGGERCTHILNLNMLTLAEGE